jgi:AcrR family transcriptional regulator
VVISVDYRQRIITACKEIVLVQGFSGFTMDDLTVRAGISKRTIYRYFNSKEEILESVLEQFLTDVRRSMDQAVEKADDPLEKMMNVMFSITQNLRVIQPLLLYDIHKHYPHLWEKVEQFRNSNIPEILESILVNNEKYFNSNINQKVFTTALLASIRAVANPTFILESNLTPEEVVRSLFAIFIHGIAAE